MSELKSLLIEAVASWFRYLVIVGKIGIRVLEICNNRAVVIGAIVIIETWLAELRQEMLESKKRPLTIIGKKIKTLGEKIAADLETEFKDLDPELQEFKELEDVGKQIDNVLFDPRMYFESKSEARKLVEDKKGWEGFAKHEWKSVCDVIALDYPSLTEAAKAAKVKYPETK
jgi:NAD-dependent DNA ligase